LLLPPIEEPLHRVKLQAISAADTFGFSEMQDRSNEGVAPYSWAQDQ
jgi:hypothetical protein